MHKLQMRAALAPDTFDADARTVEVVLSTGADVQRAGYVERLPVANADLSKIAGAPVLDAHNQGTTRAVLGVIQKAWKTNGEIRALLKLSSREDVAGIVRDIADGILRNLSIGYRVTKWADSTNSAGQRVRTALAFSIFEASIVPIGADPGAVTRSKSPMTKKTKAGETPANDDVDAPNEPANENDTQTRAAIRDIFKQVLPRDLQRAYDEADAILDSDGTEEDARTRALEIVQERTQSAPRVRVINPGVSPQDQMQHRSDAIYARVTGAKPTDAAMQYMHYRMVDHARDALTRANISTLGMSDFDIIRRAAEGVGDYPHALQGVGNRILLEQFTAAQTPLMALARTATAPDFRDLNRLRISEIGQLKALGEHGELQNVSRSELAGAYAVETAGLIFSLTFKAQVNDDLGAFRDFASAAGVQAAMYQKNVIVDLIQSNPTIEGAPLFSVAHGNVSQESYAGIIFSGGSSDVYLQALTEMRIAMRNQKGLDGVTPLSLAPKYLVVGADLETEAQQALAATSPIVSPDVNPFAGTMELLVEASLAPQTWYAFASPQACPVFEHAWLQGYTGPQIASQENFRSLSTDYRCVIHWGAGLLPGGWRGAFANFGGESSNS